MLFWFVVVVVLVVVVVFWLVNMRGGAGRDCSSRNAAHYATPGYGAADFA